MKFKAFKAAFPYTVPILMGYLFMGAAFGVLLASKGYPFYWAIIMSISMYAGSMQFVGIELLTSPFNLINAAIVTLTVNARHLFYGLSLINKFKNMGPRKLYMIHTLTDETYSLLCSVEAPFYVEANDFYQAIAMLDHIYWITGCTLGALIGSAITINTTGIDFVMTALFVVILVEQWESSKSHISALTGILVAAICLIIFGPDKFLIPAMIVILLLLSVFKKPIERRL